VPNAEATAGRLIHLAENHHHVRQHACGSHFAIKLLTFARALADATENAHPVMMPDHVVNHLGEQHGLADPRAAKQPGFSPPLERRKDVDDLDARFEHLRLRHAARERRRRAVNRPPLHVLQFAAAVDRIAEDVEHPRQRAFAHWRVQRPAGFFHHRAARQPLGRRQCNAAHAVSVALRDHFDDDLIVFPRTERRVDARRMMLELCLDHAPAHGNNPAGIRDNFRLQAAPSTNFARRAH
jgi:hypothetical protein